MISVGFYDINEHFIVHFVVSSSLIGGGFSRICNCLTETQPTFSDTPLTLHFWKHRSWSSVTIDFLRID